MKDYNSMTPAQLARKAVPIVKKILPTYLNSRNNRERIDDRGQTYEVDAYSALRDIVIIHQLGNAYAFHKYAGKIMNTLPHQVFAHAKKMIGEAENIDHE